MKTRPLNLNGIRIAAFSILCIAIAAHGQTGPPPYANVSVSHSVTGETDTILAKTGYGSLYDPSGSVDGSVGKLFHSSMAYTVGFAGNARADVYDTMSIPFTVAYSDYYNISLGGIVSAGVYSVGADISIFGSDWGNFDIGMQPMSIWDTTTSQHIYSGPFTTIYHEQTTLWEAIEPVVWDAAVLLINQYVAAKEALNAVEAADKLKEIYDTFDSIGNAVKPISANFNKSVTVYLTAGHTYRIQPHINSTATASSVYAGAGGHFSGVKGFLQVTNFSVAATTPRYSLTVQSSGASGVNVGVTPVDLEGHSSGSVPISRIYAPGSGVVLTAPATVGTQVFTTWSGVDSQSGNIGSLTMNANRNATAIYSIPPGSITITTPNGGGVYERERNLYINWLRKDSVDQTVSIELWKGGSLETVVANSALNSGYYTWRIPANQTLGTDYRVRLSALSGNLTDESDADFEIRARTSTPPRIEIRTLEDLRQMTDNWNDSQHPRDGYYVLMADVDATATRTWNGGLGFKPVGNGYNDWFRGVFDGEGHKITGLYCTRPNEAYAGLFAVTMDNAVIKNLTLEPRNIRGQGYVNRGGNVFGGVGAIVGENAGLIQNCHVYLSDYHLYVTNGNHCGGVVGGNRGTIVNSSVTGIGEITARGTVGCNGVGGIAGENLGLIRWCWVGPEIGIDADIAGSNGDEVGGIVGDNEGGRIIECESRVRRFDGEFRVGGIAGQNVAGGEVSDCFFRAGTVTGNSLLGGVVGQNDGGTVQRCYMSGTITGSGTRGSLVGRTFSIIKDSYWNTDSSAFPADGGDNSAAISNCFGRTTAEMMQQVSFTNWDFAGVWTVSEGVDFPILRGIGIDLTAPTEVTASTGLDYGVQVSWSAVADATHYMVFRSDAVDGQKIALVSNWATGLTFVDTTAQPLTTLYYWVKAGTTPDGGRASEFSSQAAGSRTQPPLEAPQNVTASDGFLNQVFVEWSTVADAGYYQVFRSATLEGAKTALTGWQTNAFFLDASGTDNTVYYYWVKAASSGSGNRASGYSVSDEGLFTTPPLPQLAASRQVGNLILSWPTNTAGFNLVSVTNLSSTNWTLVSPPPVIVNGLYAVTNSASGPAKFYRLKNP